MKEVYFFGFNLLLLLLFFFFLNERPHLKRPSILTVSGRFSIVRFQQLEKLLLRLHLYAWDFGGSCYPASCKLLRSRVTAKLSLNVTAQGLKLR